MSKSIPGKAVVKCKFEVVATLEVDIEDVYVMDRQIVDVLSHQSLFRRVAHPDYLPVDERTFGLDKPTMKRLGIKVIDIEEYGDPIPTGTGRYVRDWEIEVDEEYYVAQAMKKTGEEQMNIDYLLMWHLEEGVTRRWSLEEVLEEINRDRSDSWTDYTEEDWRDGWDEWCEGQFYKLLDIRHREEDQGGKK